MSREFLIGLYNIFSKILNEFKNNFLHPKLEEDAKGIAPLAKKKVIKSFISVKSKFICL